MKRLFDVIVASTGLLLLSPLLIAVWLAVAVKSGFPVMFRQQRVGRAGQPFTVLKFRTMEVKAGAEQGMFHAGCTARVTPIGRFLRKSKLDELPQLWNVLKGDMSMVGPRPEVQRWCQVHPQQWAKVLTVRPGITDPASIEYRNEEKMLANAEQPEEYYRDVILPRKLEIYQQYVDSHGFCHDIVIMLKTMRRVLF